VYTVRVGGTTGKTEKPMFGPDQCFTIGGMEAFDDTLEYIAIGALDITLLSSDQMAEIIKPAQPYKQLYSSMQEGN
jgi:hypothetical protein